LKKIDAKNTKDFTSLINRKSIGRNWFRANIGPDAKNSNRNVISVGSRFPIRDYYVSEDADSKEKEKSTRSR
jgi:hypothetical protein